MKHIVFSLFILFCAATSQAQTGSLSANLYGGYTFKDKVNFDAAYTEVQDGFQWGVGLEYFTSSRTSIELKYLRMDTRFPLYNPQGDQVNTGNDDGNLQYILLGANQYFPKNGSRFTPFIGGALGVGIVGGEADNATKFGWDARAGVKFNTESVVSFKLQAYIQSIISTFGSDYWVTGGGAVVAVPDYATIFQFGLGGAICFDFSKRK
ncbi:MAG: porin family protein [Chitinophagaceae bacterium]|jgi:opacity protein-like surface antigen|nr:porin family protein [Chitinophagaceae bacterium]